MKRRADGRTGGRAGLAGLTVLVLTICSSARLLAQDSQFGISGLGSPGKWESVRARSAGGAFAPFDAFSPLMDASLADVRRLSAGVTSGTSWRTIDPVGSNAASLRGTRFPALVIAGPLAGRLTIGGGFSTYLDRSFGIITQGTDTLRGVPQPYTDEITSDGGVTNVRLAAAVRIDRRLAIGAGFHLLTGSSRVVATRRFADTATYETSTSREEVAYEGQGASLSALLDPHPDLRIAGWIHSDSKLRADVRGRTAVENDLPQSYGAGVLWRPGGQAIVAGTVAWRKWATAGPNAHDTFNWSLGAEIGSASSPIRFGVRGGEMPFGVGQTPTEVGYSAGLGRQFSGGRGRLDIGLERLERKGTRLTERVWTLLLGLSVRP